MHVDEFAKGLCEEEASQHEAQERRGMQLHAIRVFCVAGHSKLAMMLPVPLPIALEVRQNQRAEKPSSENFRASATLEYVKVRRLVHQIQKSVHCAAEPDREENEH